MRLIIEEIVHITYQGLGLEQSRKRKATRKKLEKVKTLTALKDEHRKVWLMPNGDKSKNEVN